MLADYKARILLGLDPNSCPTPSEVKAAYKRKVLETHPDLFPHHEKSDAESKFKSIGEAYTLLLSDVGKNRSSAAGYSRVVRRGGVPTSHGGKRHHIFFGAQLFLIVMTTVALGGLNASRAYKRQKEINPSHNPFLP